MTELTGALSLGEGGVEGQGQKMGGATRWQELPLVEAWGGGRDAVVNGLPCG